MTEFLGSQFGILIFMGIGIGVVYLINKASKDEMNEEDKHTAVGCVFVAALIIAFLCYYFS